MTRKHDRKSWRESWRLFNQAIYIYLISCWVELSFQIKLSSQAFQLDSSAWIQLLNLTWHFFKKISTQLDAISLAASMLRIENDSFWAVVETSRLSIIKVLVWIIEESKDDRDQLECFELREIEKTEIEVFNWLRKTMTSFCIFSNISFLFIQSLFNMTSWWSISTINIDTVNFLWLLMMRLDRILWVMIFLDIFSS